MKRLLVDHKVKISASFTADDWELYTDDENAEEVAEKLNEHLEFFVNSGFESNEVHNKMWKIMNEYSKFGAADTEPMYFLDSVLSEIYSSKAA
jgi:hypothetical protein